MVYVVGGYSANCKQLERSTKYDIIENKWKNSDKLPVDFSIGITIVQVKNRFLYGFGGVNKGNQGPDSEIERVLRLDTLKKVGWLSFTINNPSKLNGLNYGVIPLGFLTPDKLQFLVFGGYNGKVKMVRSFLYITSLSQPE